MSFQSGRTMRSGQEWGRANKPTTIRGLEVAEKEESLKYGAANGFILGSPGRQFSAEAPAVSGHERPPPTELSPPEVSPIHGRDDEYESWVDYSFADTLGDKSFCLDFFGETTRTSGSDLQLPKDGSSGLELTHLWGDTGPAGKDPPSPVPLSSDFPPLPSCPPTGRPATAAAAMAHAAGRAAGLVPLQSGVEVFSEVRTYVQPGTRKWGRQRSAGRGDRNTTAGGTSLGSKPSTMQQQQQHRSFPTIPPFDPSSKMTMNGGAAETMGRFPHFSHCTAPLGWVNLQAGAANGGIDVGLHRINGQQQQPGSMNLASDCLAASRYTGSSSMVSSGADSSTTLIGREAATTSVANLSGDGSGAAGGRGGGQQPSNNNNNLSCRDEKVLRRGHSLQQRGGCPRVVRNGVQYVQENFSGQTDSDVCKSGEDVVLACNRVEDAQETYSLNTSEGPRSESQRGSQERSGTRSSGKGRRLDETEDDGECQLQENGEEASGGLARQAKRSRASEVHNLSERRRRDRINERMKALQELIPNSNKTDKASMLDEAIEYIKMLQLQLQVMSMRCGAGMTPMMMPPGTQMMGRWNGPMGHDMSQMNMGMFPTPGMMGPFNSGHVVNMQPMMEAGPPMLPWGVGGLHPHPHDTISPGSCMRGLEG